MKEGFNCFQVYVNLTRLKLNRGEGKLVGSPEVGSRGRIERFPQYLTLVQPRFSVETPEIMSHEVEPKNMIEDEKTFIKAFFDMTDMVKVLYEERKPGCKGKVPNLPKEKALQEEVMEKKVM